MAQTPTSPVELINLSLSTLGVPRISSLDPPNNNVAELAAGWYPLIRQCFLRMGVWNFAKARLAISRTGTPAFDWADAYLIPVECIRILSVEGETERYQTRQYDVEGREILLNAGGASSIKLRYVVDVEDLSLWTPDAKYAFMWLMVSALAYPLTRSKEVQAWAESMLTRALPDAKSVDGQEAPVIVIDESRSITERLSMGSLGTAGPWTIVD